VPAPLISGFTIVRNALKLDFPVEASIRSILPICDEVVVNVGRSEDETLELVRSIGDPRIRIVETEWDMSRRNTVLGHETLRAMRACRHPWGVYIQADEVLHERGAAALLDAVRRHDADPQVEGLLVRYLHFYGGFDTIATHRRWYRREVRAVRLDPALDIRPYQGAQGFRVGPEHRKIRARLTEAEMFHYGWARPAQALREKRELGKTMYPWRDASARLPLLEWIPGMQPFRGTHPAVAREWIEARRSDPDRLIAPRRFRLRFIRYYISGWIERMTGVRVFEFRNYELV
jgi:glycosyltransferase involved in cell wall biosynthesis